VRAWQIGKSGIADLDKWPDGLRAVDRPQSPFSLSVLEFAGGNQKGHIRGLRREGRGAFVAPFAFAFLAGFSPVSFEMICSIVSIMPRMASGRVYGSFCLSIQASSAFR
jgi:hypothetical protein